MKTFGKPHNISGERGATLTETALLISMILVVSVILTGAIGYFFPKTVCMVKHQRSDIEEKYLFDRETETCYDSAFHWVKYYDYENVYFVH